MAIELCPMMYVTIRDHIVPLVLVVYVYIDALVTLKVSQLQDDMMQGRIQHFRREILITVSF